MVPGTASIVEPPLSGQTSDHGARQASLFMVKDKKALRRWFADEFRKAPPRWLIPAHGDIVDFAADGAAFRSLFGTAS